MLTALACDLEADDVFAVPIPTQITYSTSGPESLKTSRGDVVFEFQPVANLSAMVGSTLRLGTFLIHQASPGKGYTFDLAMLPITRSVTSINGEAVTDPNETVSFNNLLNANIDESGKVMGGLTTFQEVNGDAVLRSGGQTLSLKPVEAVTLWNISAEPSVVAVDVFARIGTATIPEPSVLLIFAAAVGFGWRRPGRPD